MQYPHLDDKTVTDVFVRMNDRFHDAMQEAQKIYTKGIPLGALSLFFAVQISHICRQSPEFKTMLFSEISRLNAKHQPNLSNQKNKGDAP